ncbi:hypothetical protein, partial [Paraburkholderia sediminicola]|uniref:hypothetical protein n=1 Tax=Paraburkholderia sediminicola TaxID=458836 RepID=UPI0038BD953B
TNKPITNQGKANATGTQPKSATQATKSSNPHRRRQTNKQSAAQATQITRSLNRQNPTPKPPSTNVDIPPVPGRKPKPLPQCPIARKRPKQQMNRK